VQDNEKCFEGAQDLAKMADIRFLVMFRESSFQIRFAKHFLGRALLPEATDESSTG
jgi:hypothetical protein